MAPEKAPDYTAPLPTDGPNIGSSLAGAAKDGFAAVSHPFSKGGVFNQMWKTATGKNAYETDNMNLAFKNLQPGAVQSQMAMPAIEPGDSQTHINGMLVTHVDKDARFVFKEQRFETTIGESEITHLARRTTSVGEKEVHLVYGEQQVFVNGESSAQYTGKRDTKAPEDFEWKQLERSFSETKFEGALVATGITGALFEFTGLDCSLKGKEVFGSDISEMLKKEFGAEEGAAAAEEVAGETAAVATEGAEVATVAVEGAEVAAVAVEGAEALAVGAAVVVAAPEILVGAAVVGVVALGAWGLSKVFGGSSSSSSSAPSSSGESGGSSSSGGLGEGGASGGGGAGRSW